MKVRFFLVFLFIFKSINLLGQNDKPKLVVMITVDQMRYDYLPKYWERFGSNGFKRLIGQGFTFENANFSYVPTMTAVGHATIGTGTTPVHHGIAANDWYDRLTKKDVYCVSDTTVYAVGVNGMDGMHSPRNLKSNTFTDQLKLRSPKSKVIGISLKDRGAILPVGFAADAAYWFSSEKGHFITSSYYMEELPSWINAFNAKKHVINYLKKPWNTFYSINAYKASSIDNAEYEGKFKGEANAAFPHDLPNLIDQNGLGLIKGTPFGNSLLVDFATELIKQESFGTDEYTDVLSISFSSTDYIGHMFGPQSIEVEDTYLRLDHDIANLLAFLDKTIGKKQYTVVLTADHGAADIPAHTGGSTGYYNTGALTDSLENWSQRIFGCDVIERITNQQIYLDYTVIDSEELELDDVRELLTDFLLSYPAIIASADMKGRRCVGEEALCNRMYNGFDPKRSGDIFYSFQAGWLSDYYQSKGGTGHSTAFKYDTHVPMIWFGWGVSHGAYQKEVAIKDIAVSLSNLIQIPPPNGATGNSLYPHFNVK